MTVAELDSNNDPGAAGGTSEGQENAKPEIARSDTEKVEALPTDGSPTDELASLLQACPDSRLTSALPGLLQALPDDAQDRCLIVLREALCDEVEGGVFEGNGAGAAIWRRILTQSPSAASSKPLQSSAKRSFHAMAVPFQMPVAKRAREENDELQLDTVSPSTSSSVYVANVPYHASEQTIFAWFQSKCAEGELVDVRLLLDSEGSPKGAAILTYDTPKAANAALLLNGQTGLEYRKLIVKLDHMSSNKGEGKEGKGRLKRGSKGLGKGAKGETDSEKSGLKETSKGLKGEGKAGDPESDSRSVVLKNLAFNATEASIGELFAGCGEVAAVRIAKDSRSGKSRGFAVVEFTDKEAVPEAVKRSGKLVRGRTVRVEALGKPVQAEEKHTSDTVKDAGSESEVHSTQDSKGTLEETGEKPQAVSTSTSNEVKVAVQVQESDSSVVETCQQHAQKLIARAQAGVEDSEQAMEPPKKQARAEKTSTLDEVKSTFPGGEEGFTAAVGLVRLHGSAEALLEALGAESLKGRLAALGMKAGGSPIERAQRLMKLRDMDSLDQAPRDILSRPSKKAETSEQKPSKKAETSEPLAPVESVKASEDTHQETTTTSRGVEVAD